ncbi:UDP-N-acetylmuramoyl-L-alanyl-D-glutamate--2,6-diaminopimelate ligase [Candidatus Acidulodesulfobacterium sp. H_13]|uniref:UDP-N-acetylmuramoyl-L-alanyl-D-glutamate--2, 6-diaminopimelate ligase n=1 Tax=Candidatus Acidulodesulfobacterium sp. H_13 TaxID=3395470 RepID=UPI003AF96019
MKLKHILSYKDDSDLKAIVYGSSDIDIVGISNDSRNIKRGYMFAARKGAKVDSNIYIEEAISKGASAILTDNGETAKRLIGRNVAAIVVRDALKAYAAASKNFFNNPADKIKTIGVTGTNGKTTTTFLIQSILEDSGCRTGLIGTIDCRIGSDITCSKNTTPDAYELNKMLDDAVRSSIGYCVMEVSSHSLTQDRVYGISYDAAVFTNLTRDHLDYHGDMEKYYTAKKKLFFEILLKSAKKQKFALINNDDTYGKRLILELREEKSEFTLITYGLNKDSDIFAQNIVYSKDGLKLDIILPDKKEIRGISSKLIGSHNVYNILAAASAAYALSVPVQHIAAGIRSLNSVPGRVEKVNIANAEAPMVYIDYAHTDDALARVLSVLKGINGGRLISVFGCGGDRDKGKRPLMGKHSADIADITIITSDNPRSEDPLKIIKEIKTGIENALFVDIDANKNTSRLEGSDHICVIVEDRAKAIELALSVSRVEDTVLIAGKGHEDYMIIKNNKYHFSDKEEVLKYYENRI